MGCCLSKTQNQNPDHQKYHQPHHHHHHHLRPSLPDSNPTHEVLPPPLLEEESVKEVLSETPITKPHEVPILKPESGTLLSSLQNPDGKFETKYPIPSPIIINNKEEEISEVVSQLSEGPCSISESFSTATTTTTITEKKEEEATSKRSIREGTPTSTSTKATAMKNHKWNNNRSPSRKRPLTGDGNVPTGRELRLKSPARRSEPSPEKRVHGGSRPIRGRESGPAANRKLNVGPSGVRRDAGEGSGRRSRPPSCARAVGPAGKVGTAGGGRKQVPAAKGAVVKEEEQKGGTQSEEVGEKNDIVAPEESIENPLVSMECFIFL